MAETTAHEGENIESADKASPATDEQFDFDKHRKDALEEYQAVRGQYEDCAKAVESVLKAALEQHGIRVHTLESRAKDLESFGRKAARPSDADPQKPKYADPLADITDLAAARVITLLLADVDRVNEQVENQFRVVERVNKSGLLLQEEKLGYHSVHYVVAFSAERCGMPEYARFADLVAEIQVRTILQHAWAEIEHDIQYKAAETIPALIRRRFMALAGLLEIADREFQAVSNEDQRVRVEALRRVEGGDLAQVEVTEESLKAYLDRKLGPDGRMSSFGYEWTARLLKRLGFSNLQQVDETIAAYDDDRISRVLHGGRQGQLTRFEDVLLASLGDRYLEKHPWGQGEYADAWSEFWRDRLERLERAGITPRQ